jgi:uncharacterized protein YbgA (DUF1722 family)
MTEEFANKKWNQQCEKLVEFKQKNGHHMVPQRNKEDKILGIWVCRQQSFHKKNKLRLDRRKILDKIGFAWKADRATTFKPDNKHWHQQREKLVEFKRQNGHCVVPFNCQQDKSLGQWVSHQRTHCDNIRPDRKRILDEIGFVWTEKAANTNNKLWQQQCEKLLKFKQKNGHCRVPCMHEQDESLGRWVRNQRARHVANDKMQPNRKELLEALDFVWKAGVVATRSSATQGHVKNRSECPSPNTKRPSTSLVESGGMGARTNQRGKAAGGSSSVEENGVGRDEDDSEPCLVTSSAARTCSSPGQEAVQEQAATLGEIPHSWTKLEPDC